MPDTLLICHVLGLIVWCFLTFKELETLNSQSTQRLKINLENMAIKKIWRLLNSELIKAILSEDPWLKGLPGIVLVCMYLSCEHLQLGFKLLFFKIHGFIKDLISGDMTR